jgi:hypothetical protein
MQTRMHASRVEQRLAELVAFDTRNPGCRVFDRVAGEPTRGALLRFLMGTERLAKLPARYMTGHLVAVLARKTG